MQLQGGYQKGFTLIELISVVILLSILGVAAFARLGDMKGYESTAFFNDTVSALQYAQKLSMSTGCRVQVTLTATSYALHQGAAGCGDLTYPYTLPVANPANRNTDYQANAPAGVTMASSVGFPVQVRFTPDSSLENLATDAVFSIGARQFTLFKNSGLVDVQ